MDSGVDDIYLCASTSKIQEYRDLIDALKGEYHVLDLDKHADNPKSVVLVLGGDGTLNYFLNQVEKLDNLRVIYFPCGTANDFSKSLRLSPVVPSLPIIEDILRSSTLFSIPVMKCNEKRFINVATIGAPAKVTQSGSDLVKKYAGTLSYYMSALEEIISPEIVNMRYYVDEELQEEASVFGFAITQGIFAGGGVKLSPSFFPNFGQYFEFTALKSDSLADSISFLLKMQQKDAALNLEEQSLIHKFTRRLIVESQKEMSVKLDGEEYCSNRLEFKKEKSKINFYYY